MMLHLDQEYLLHRWSQRLDKEVGRWTARYVLTSAERQTDSTMKSNELTSLRDVQSLARPPGIENSGSKYSS
jgi:hypothetical protein